MASGVHGPFRPGTGATPPYLAGRSTEKALFREWLAELAQRIPPGTQVVLYGPRGNGKTVLLDWLEKEASCFSGVTTAVLRPAEVSDPERLTDMLAPKSWWRRLAGSGFAVGGFSWRPGAAPAPAAGDVLIARAKAHPLVMVVDEAHTLRLDVGRVLLNAAQEAGREHPFLLVLAGTPNLEGRLNAMGVSFWDRARQLGIGRLDAKATVEAFRRPFEAAGNRVDDGALAEMVRLSHGYPFFIQLLGREAWAEVALPGTSGVLTQAALARAKPGFEHRKRDYYRQRYRELEDRGLLAAGRAVAEAFHGTPVLDTADLREAISGATPDQDSSAIARTQRALSDLGFIWGASPDPSWEPGIPSLMDYVREHSGGR